MNTQTVQAEPKGQCNSTTFPRNQLMGEQGYLEAVLLWVAHLDPTAANSTEAEGSDERSPTWATSTNPMVSLALQCVSEECHPALLMEQAQRKKRKRKINATESMHLITILSILPSFMKHNFTAHARMRIQHLNSMHRKLFFTSSISLPTHFHWPLLHLYVILLY